MDGIIGVIEKDPGAGLAELKLEQKRMQVSGKAFLTALRHALTGMKVREVLLLLHFLIS